MRGGAVGDVGVHEQRLGGVAHAGAVGLGVHHDGERLVEVGGGVDVDVAVADAGLDHRHRRLLHHAAISPAPPRGMRTSTRPRARISAFTSRGCRPARAGRRRRAAPTPRAASRSTATIAALDAGARRAAQQHRVARLQADPGGVGGDVGPGLVDHPDDAERHPHLASSRLLASGAAHHLADRVGQPGDLAQPQRPWRPIDFPRFVEPEAVDDGGGGTAASRTGDVLGVGGEHLDCPREPSSASAMPSSAASFADRVARASSWAASRARRARARTSSSLVTARP